MLDIMATYLPLDFRGVAFLADNIFATDMHTPVASGGH